MGAPPGLAAFAATLLEADPVLARVTGMREATAIGNRPVLPVLTVETGAWIVPARGRLGPGTVALIVLDGLLLSGSGGPAALIGPGDPLEPWDERVRWIACTPARLAVIGRAYSEALRAWPEAADRLRARAPVAGPLGEGGSVEDRLLALLWRIALHWGAPDGQGIALPRVLNLHALRLILGTPELELALALAALRGHGATIRPDGAVWLHAAAGSSRRETLRARAAWQLAVARATHDRSRALFELLDLGLRGSDAGYRDR